MTTLTLLCSDPEHPVYSVLLDWKQKQSDIKVTLRHRMADLDKPTDLLILVSCSEYIPKQVRNRYRHTLVLHASDLPYGRGWNPHVWEIVEGASRLVLSLLEAEDKIDSGAIWRKLEIPLNGTELYDEINEKLFAAELELIEWSCKHFQSVEAQAQQGEPSYYRKRTPDDSRLDPDKTISEQFDLLRVCDPDRFPAYFELRGQRYTLTINKAEEQ